MTGGRYVVLACSSGEAAWLSGLPGVEVVHCADVDEATVLVSGSRRWSAALVVGAPDGSFVRAAHRAAVPILAIGPAGAPGGLPAAQPAAVPILASGPAGPGVVAVSRSAVLEALHTWATPVPWARWHPSMPDPPPSGRLIAVCGPGGTGASTVAMAVASGLASSGSDLVLADLALRSGQAVLHGIKQPMATVDDLVHAHRLGGFVRLGAGHVRDFTVPVSGHPYRLLPGLRRPCQWTGVRPMAFDAALAGLRSAFDLVVADVTGDFEGENDTGSLDVEERNHMARHTVSLADIVVAVGSPGPTGRRSLDYTVEALSQLSIDPDRLVTIVNRTSVTDRPGAIALPPLRPNETAVEWARPASRIVARLLDQLPLLQHQPELVPVVPGSIGHWDESC